MRPDRLRAIALNDRFWVFFFALQTANVMAFYWSVGTSNVMTMIIVQVAGAASGAFFFALSCQATAGVGARVFLATVVALVALTTLTVQGLFSILEAVPGFGFRNTPYGACCRICRLFCSGYGGGCLLASAIRTRALCSDGSAATQGGIAGSSSWSALFRPVPHHRRLRGSVRIPPRGTSSSVPRCLEPCHGVPLRCGSGPQGCSRRRFRQSDGTDVVRLWNRFYQYVFPIVTVAALLGPLTMDTEFLPLLILQACALYYFDVLLAVASYTIARVIKASPTQVFARAFLVKSAGFFLGCLVGFGVHESVVLDETAFSVIGAAIFVILSLDHLPSPIRRSLPKRFGAFFLTRTPMESWRAGGRSAAAVWPDLLA